MSSTSNIRYKCQKCGKDYETTKYESINVTLDPKFKEKLFTGKIYETTCPYCKHKDVTPYPICYHDMEKKFMVSSGIIEELIKLNENHIKGGDDILEWEMFLNEGYQMWGASSHDDLCTKVCAIDNGLNPVIAEFFIDQMVYSYLNSEDAKKDNSRVDGRFLTEVDGKLYVAIALENGNISLANFSMDNYNIASEVEIAKKLATIHPFIFNKDSLDKFYNDFEKNSNFEEQKVKLCYIAINDELTRVAVLPKYNENKFNIDDKVICEDASCLIEGTIIKIIEVNEYDYPLMSIPVVARNVDDVELITSETAIDKLDNKELLKKLKALKDSGDPRLFPVLDLKNSEFIAITKTYVENNNDDLYSVLNNQSTDEVKMKFATKDIDGLNYLCLYSSNKEVKEDGEISKCVYKFDNIIKLIINSTEFDGIIIDPNGLDLDINYHMIKKYCSNKVMEDGDYLREILLKLNKEEIEYIPNGAFGLISQFYNSNISLEEMAQMLNITKDQLGLILRDGYMALVDIVRHNYC